MEVDSEPLEEQWPARESQIKQLSILLSPSLPSPPTIVVYGPEAVGKTGLLRSYLERSDLLHAVIQCQECITGRHLIERAAAACAEVVHRSLTNGHRTYQPSSVRCENLSAFTETLTGLLRNVDRFVLVLDGVDEQREAAPTLLPALARLGTMIPGLTIVLIVRHPSPRFLHATGIPHIYFPPYEREQAVAILCLDPPPIYSRTPSPSLNFTEESLAEDNLWLWSRFLQAVWDSLAKGAARDLVAFRTVAQKLWRPFVQPVVDGTFGTRDFSRLVVAQRKLLQDESCLGDSIISEVEVESTPMITHDLPYYSKWILCAAYLASFNPARLDPIHFMKSADRKKRKKGGGTVAGRRAKHRKIPRHLLAPGAFSLDRLFAILHAILPHDLTPNIDIYTQVATLGSLRLLVRSGIFGTDVLEPGSKWKVNFAWDYVTKIARNIELDLTDYVAE
ncbi:hypothetical protein MBLNU457_3582t1 [Dothideomycetes sp. NU457]